jgi:hypothetical protein
MLSPNNVRRLLATRVVQPLPQTPEFWVEPGRAEHLLDRVEARLWTRHDARMRAAGWEVIRLGRWRRQCRHPDLLARGTSARRAMTAEEDATQKSGRPPGRLVRLVHPVSVSRLRRHASTLSGEVDRRQAETRQLIHQGQVA